jgi:prolipoprotein diacylglyceryltransferase
MGQVLSTPMIIIGIAFFWWAYHAPRYVERTAA